MLLWVERASWEMSGGRRKCQHLDSLVGINPVDTNPVDINLVVRPVLQQPQVGMRGVGHGV